jgi:protein-tyrosine phosphatase
MGQESIDLCPSADQRRDLELLLRVMPGLADLARRQPGDPELPRVFHASTKTPGGTYPMVHIPVFGRQGTLWVGRLPGAGREATMEEELDAIVEFGIRRVVCLVPEASQSAYVDAARARFGIGFRLVGVADFGTPSDDERFERELSMVDEELGAGTQVLVHCHAGCGRTGMFVSCLLVRAGEPPLAAVRRYRRLRACGPETPEQVAYVFRYSRRLGSGVCAV